MVIAGGVEASGSWGVQLPTLERAIAMQSRQARQAGKAGRQAGRRQEFPPARFISF